jgi:YfiH family protein
VPEFIVPDWPAPPSVRARVTTRAHGNLADHVDFEKSAVAARRAELGAGLPGHPLWLTQVHGTCCVLAEGAKTGLEADAAVSRTPGAVCAVLTADCLPVLLCDDAGTVVAAAHAGWRGLAAGILESTVAKMATPGHRLMVWLGPAIGPSVFEVGEDVVAAFMRTDKDAVTAFSARSNGKWLCDLYALARMRLRRLGIERVAGGEFCTFTDADRFYSYRREGNTGRMASLIWIV